MKVYVCYFDWNEYEGCSKPICAFADEEAAKDWVAKFPGLRRYEECEVK